MKKKKPPQPTTPQPVELAACMSIAQSAGLHRTLVACLASGAPILVDGGGVQQIDTAILQLLASTWLGAARRGVECRWKGASEALRRSAALIGVAETLKLEGASSL